MLTWGVAEGVDSITGPCGGHKVNGSLGSFISDPSGRRSHPNSIWLSRRALQVCLATAIVGVLIVSAGWTYFARGTSAALVSDGNRSLGPFPLPHYSGARGVDSGYGRGVSHPYRVSGLGTVVSTIDLAANRTLPGSNQPPVQDLPQLGTFDPLNGFLYIRGYLGDAISVVNGTTDRVTTDLGTGYSQQLFGLVDSIAVDTTTGYVYADNVNAGNISIIDGKTNTVTGTVGVGGSPTGIVFDPSSGDLYVSDHGANNVTVVSGANNHTVANIPVGSDPQAILFDPTSNHVFVANYGNRNVSVIDAATNQVTANPSVGSYPGAMILDTVDDQVDVANSNNGASSNVTVLSAMTGAVVKTIGVGWGPQALTYDSGSNQAFVSNGASHNVSVISQSTLKVAATIPIGYGSGPLSMVFAPATGLVYVTAYGSQNVSVINGATDALVGTVATDNFPTAAILDRTNGNVFIVNTGSPTVEANLTVLSGSTPQSNGSIPLNIFPVGPIFNPGTGRVEFVDPSGNTTDSLDPAVEALVGVTHVGRYPGALVYDSSNGETYTVTHGTYNVSAINSAGKVVANIPVGYSPAAIAFDSANDFLYVTDAYGGNVSVIDGSTNKIHGSILIKAYDNLQGVLYDPHNQLIYVADDTGENVTVINGATDLIAGTIKVGYSPKTLAFDPSNNTIFVANSGSGNISVINDTTNKVVANILLTGASFLLYDPATNAIYNGEEFTDDLDAINASTYASLGSTLWMGSGQYISGLTYDPTNQDLYVATEFGDSISVLSTASTYRVKFTESGLPPGTMWSVTLGGNLETDTTNTISFYVPNGAYPWTLGVVLGYVGNVTSGTVTVLGGNQTVLIGFVPAMFAVVFQESGLPPCTMWSVTLGGTTNTSTTTTVDISVVNGLYSYTIGTVSGYTSNVTTGTIDINNGGQTILVGFSPVSPTEYSVTFQETGLPSQLTWQVTLGGTTNSSSTTTIGFLEPNGPYTYVVGAVSGYTGAPASGTITVLNAGVQKTITFTPTGTPLSVGLSASPSSIVLGQSTTLTATTSGGTAPFKFAYLNLPPGCSSLNSSTLPCTPNGAGTYSVTVNVTDSKGNFAADSTVVTVTSPPSSSPSGSSGLPVWEWLLPLVVAVVVVLLLLLLLQRRRKEQTEAPEGPPEGRN